MRAAPRPKPVRKAEEIHLVDGVKNRHQRMLNDLVLQGGNAQRPHASIRLGDVGPFGGLGTISPAMNSLMQVVQAAHQSILVVSPCHTVDARSSLPFEVKETVTEQFNGYVVEQSCEPNIAMLLCNFSHTSQSDRRGAPALRPGPGRL